MKQAFSVIVLLPLCLSCTAHQDDHSQLIREIDAAVTVPEGALPLESYAGYYSMRPDGKIGVFYDGDVRDGGEKWATETCSEVASDDTFIDVPCSPDDRPRAGERHWVEYERMPDAADGGCIFINVLYNPTAHRVERVFCNGPYEKTYLTAYPSPTGVPLSAFNSELRPPLPKFSTV